MPKLRPHNLLFILANLVGLAGFLYPFLLPAAGLAAQERPDAPLLFFIVTSLCLLILLADLSARELDPRTIALMGVLAALNAALRLIENTVIVIPGGFTPVFLLIILCGYTFGSRFGFLFGALSLLASALITGGLGPWIPYQMIAAGWIGLGAGLLPHPERPQIRRALLIAYGAVWGLLYGALLNLYFWPFISGPQSWAPGLSLLETLQRYLTFYTVTSFIWDLSCAAGNIGLLFFLSPPLLHILERFQRRTRIIYESNFHLEENSLEFSRFPY